MNKTDLPPVGLLQYWTRWSNVLSLPRCSRRWTQLRIQHGKSSKFPRSSCSNQINAKSSYQGNLLPRKFGCAQMERHFSIESTLYFMYSVLHSTVPSIFIQVGFTVHLQYEKCKIFFKVDGFPCLSCKENFVNQTVVLFRITKGLDVIARTTTYFFCCLTWS